MSGNYFFLVIEILDTTTITMAAATDKARFFLEQSVPELKEYEKKKIFGKVWQVISLLGVSGEELIFFPLQ